MNRIKLITFLFLSPILGFSLLALMSYFLAFYAEKSLPEDSLDDSSVRTVFSYVAFIAFPVLVFVVLSNSIIWFKLVSKKSESLMRFLLLSFASFFGFIVTANLVYIIIQKPDKFALYLELGFILVLLFTFSVIHLPSCCFYWLSQKKKLF